MRQNGEPSVEEILASIKQVIARDSRAGIASTETARGQPPEGDSQQSAETKMSAEEDVLDLSETIRLDACEVAADSPLLTEDARAAMRDSLAALAALSGPGAAPQIVRSGETSLEGLVRDMLRPALTEWLDKHLPALVERLVAAEIARIVGKKG
ncbi:DUF2497 domain-containing protein [Novosphingobium sp. M1R2S20]|uniref:DUF2497 domain-containing protein n=1 Tax=Novosphingobium rhizovicinum TaxID=3228928 RepID=A0ABV3R9K2_9SPHN